MVKCPCREDGVHDLTTGSTCACGWEMKVMRYSFSVEVHDGMRLLVNDCANTNSLAVVADALEDAAEKLRKL